MPNDSSQGSPLSGTDLAVGCHLKAMHSAKTGQRVGGTIGTPSFSIHRFAVFDIAERPKGPTVKKSTAGNTQLI